MNPRDLVYKDSDIAGKSVLLRLCLNVSFTEDGEIAEKSRLRESAKTIKDLAASARRVVILAHLGRPEGKEEKYSLNRILEELQKET
ncbi:MAG: phosphoglycerate kinase, partial [Candidatus Dojkabacteria bacterium]